MTADIPQPGRPMLSRRSYVQLAVLGFTHAVGAMSFTVVVAMAPVVREALDLSATRFGVLASVYFVMHAIVGLPAGGIIDRIGVRWALIGANLLVAVSALLLSVAETFSAAAIAMGLSGLAYGFVNPATSKGVLDWIPAHRRGTAMGLKQSGVPLGGVLGAGIGAMVTVFDWRHLMLAVVALALFAAFTSLALPHGPKRSAAGAWPQLKADLRIVLFDPNLNIFNIGAGIYQAGQFNFFAYIVLFMRESLHASQPLAAACLAVGQVASAAGRLGWGAVSDFLFTSRRKPVLIIMGSIGILTLILLAVTGPGWGVPVGVVLTALLGLTLAGHVALVQIVVVETTEPEVAATAVGYNRLFTAIGASAGPPLFGLTVDLTGGYAAGWLLTGAIVLAATTLIGVRFHEGRRSTAE